MSTTGNDSASLIIPLSEVTSLINSSSDFSVAIVAPVSVVESADARLDTSPKYTKSAFRKNAECVFVETSNTTDSLYHAEKIHENVDDNSEPVVDFTDVYDNENDSGELPSAISIHSDEDKSLLSSTHNPVNPPYVTTSHFLPQSDATPEKGAIGKTISSPQDSSIQAVNLNTDTKENNGNKIQVKLPETEQLKLQTQQVKSKESPKAPKDKSSQISVASEIKVVGKVPKEETTVKTPSLSKSIPVSKGIIKSSNQPESLTDKKSSSPSSTTLALLFFAGYIMVVIIAALSSGLISTTSVVHPLVPPIPGSGLVPSATVDVNIPLAKTTLKQPSLDIENVKSANKELEIATTFTSAPTSPQSLAISPSASHTSSDSNSNGSSNRSHSQLSSVKAFDKFKNFFKTFIFKIPSKVQNVVSSWISSLTSRFKFK